MTIVQPHNAILATGQQKRAIGTELDVKHVIARPQGWAQGRATDGVPKPRARVPRGRSHTPAIRTENGGPSLVLMHERRTNGFTIVRMPNLGFAIVASRHDAPAIRAESGRLQGVRMPKHGR